MTQEWRREWPLLLVFQSHLPWHVLLAPSCLWQKLLSDPGDNWGPLPHPLQGTLKPQEDGLSLPIEHKAPKHHHLFTHSSLSDPVLPAWAKESLKTISSLANDAALQKVSPRWKTAHKWGVFVIFTTTAGKKLLPSRIKLLGNVFEKLMETRASVALLSHLTPACAESFLGMDVSWSRRHTKSLSPTSLPFSLQT